jgi:hypothetical protein
MDAALNDRPIFLVTALPQGGEPKEFLISQSDQKWRLATVLIQVPFVEAAGQLEYWGCSASRARR